MVHQLSIEGFTVVDGSVTSLKDADYIFLPERHTVEAHRSNICGLINTIGKGTLFVESTEEWVSSIPRLYTNYASVSSSIAMKGWDCPIERKKVDNLCDRIKQVVVFLENLDATSFSDAKRIVNKMNSMIRIEEVNDFFDRLENFLKKSQFSEIAQEELKIVEAAQTIIKTYVNFPSDKTCDDEERIKVYKVFLKDNKFLCFEYLRLIVYFGAVVRNQCMVEKILTKDNISIPRIIVAGSGHICTGDDVYALECAAVVKKAMLGKKFLILKPDDSEKVSIKQKADFDYHSVHNFLRSRMGWASVGLLSFFALPNAITQVLPDSAKQAITLIFWGIFWGSFYSRVMQSICTSSKGYLEIQTLAKRLVDIPVKA